MIVNYTMDSELKSLLDENGAVELYWLLNNIYADLSTLGYETIDESIVNRLYTLEDDAVVIDTIIQLTITVVNDIINSVGIIVDSNNLLVLSGILGAMVKFNIDDPLEANAILSILKDDELDIVTRLASLATLYGNITINDALEAIEDITPTYFESVLSNLEEVADKAEIDSGDDEEQFDLLTKLLNVDPIMKNTNSVLNLFRGIPLPDTIDEYLKYIGTIDNVDKLAAELAIGFYILNKDKLSINLAIQDYIITNELITDRTIIDKIYYYIEKLTGDYND